MIGDIKMAKQFKASKNHVEQMRSLIKRVDAWNPNKPNWELFNALTHTQLLHIIELYLVQMSKENRTFALALRDRTNITSKQKFKLLCVVSNDTK